MILLVYINENEFITRKISISHKELFLKNMKLPKGVDNYENARKN